MDPELDTISVLVLCSSYCVTVPSWLSRAGLYLGTPWEFWGTGYRGREKDQVLGVRMSILPRDPQKEHAPASI